MKTDRIHPDVLSRMHYPCAAKRIVSFFDHITRGGDGNLGKLILLVKVYGNREKSQTLKRLTDQITEITQFTLQDTFVRQKTGN